MPHTDDAPRRLLLIGFEPAKAADLTSVFDQVGHLTYTAESGAEAAAILEAVIIDIALADLEGGFAEVLGGIAAAQARGRPRCPLVGVGSVKAAAAMTDALRTLGLAALVPCDASPQELLFRVHRIVYAERHAENPISPRVPVSLPATVEGPQGAIEGQVLNVSATGLFVEIDPAVPVNAAVRVRFALEPDAEPISATCRVVWTNAGGEGSRYFRGMGLQFLQMSTEARQQLNTFLLEAYQQARPLMQPPPA